MEIKINHLDYGIMKIAIETKSQDKTNYVVKITDVTIYNDGSIYNGNKEVADREIGILNLNTKNPDSLKVIKTSKSYSKDLIIGIIKGSLSKAFTQTNINMTTPELVTSQDLSQKKALSLAKKRFNGRSVMPKVINW